MLGTLPILPMFLINGYFNPFCEEVWPLDGGCSSALTAFVLRSILTILFDEYEFFLKFKITLGFLSPSLPRSSQELLYFSFYGRLFSTKRRLLLELEELQPLDREAAAELLTVHD
jgi:hypothetical protein